MKKIKKKRYIYKSQAALAICALIALSAGIFYVSPSKKIITMRMMAKGNFYFNGGAYDLDKAVKYYKIASAIESKLSFAHYQIARIYFLQNKLSDAKVEIDRALSEDSSNKRSFYVRGLIDGYSKNYKEAQEDFIKFIEWAPTEWAGYNDLAWAYYEDQDYENAAKAAKRGLEISPSNAWLLNGLGVSLQGLGENDIAKDTLERSAEMAKSMTASEWRAAYPGNDGQTAEWDLGRFRTEVNYNLQLAANPTFSGKGIFQDACAGSNVKACSGTTCVDNLVCDAAGGCLGPAIYQGYWYQIIPGTAPGACSLIALDGRYIDNFWTHASSSTPFCETLKSCSSDCDCGAPSTSWSPATSTVCVGENFTQRGNCGGTRTAIGTKDCSCVDSSWTGDDPSSVCIGESLTQTSNCGNTRVVPGTKICSVNNAPIVTIIEPVNGATGLSQSSIIFRATVSDPDGDAVTVNSSQITVTSGGALYHDAFGSINFTYGPFARGVTYTWTVTASDGKGGSTTRSTTFTIENCVPTSGSCGSASGSSICNSMWPPNSALCSDPTKVQSKSEGGVYGDWTWSCVGSCGGSTVDCSARGARSCGWIETTP